MSGDVCMYSDMLRARVDANAIDVMRRKQKEEAESQGRGVVFIGIQAGAVHAHSLTLCLQGSLDSEPHDASVGTLVITRGWPWQRATKATSGSALCS